MNRLSMIVVQVVSVLSAYKARTAIAVTGVLLGAMALVIVQNISSSLQDKVAQDIKAVGDRVITVFARTPRLPGQMPRRERVKTLKIEDIDALLTINNVIEAAPSVRGGMSAKYMNSTVSTVVIGSTNTYFDLRGLSFTDGRLFDPIEMRAREKVAVLGSEVAKELFGDISPIGETIYLGAMTFEVIGILAEKGADTSGTSLDNIVIIPVNTALTRVFNRNYLNEILLRINSWDDFDMVADDVSRVLRIQHRIQSPDRPNDFEIINPVDEQKTSNTLIHLASLLGSASAGIAFFIGAVGIFSLMLLIVNQRITEIGIKRAIGATKRDILFQFLFESGFIGIMGGLSGIVMGCVISLAVSYFAHLPYSVSLKGALIGLTTSIISGIVAGLYPAMRASRVVPVKALQL